MSDGKIVFNTKIDNSNIEKDLKDLERKIQKAEESISKNENKKLPLVKQAEALGVKLDQAKAKAAQLKAEMAEINTAMGAGSEAGAYSDAYLRRDQIAADLKAQETEVVQLQKQWDRVNDKVDLYDRNIKDAQNTIVQSRTKAADLAKQMNSAGAAMKGAFEKANAAAANFEKRVISLVKRVFVFTVIAQALRSIKDYMGKVLKTNEEFTTQIAKLKAALVTAFQPLYEFILPGLIAALKVLTDIVSALANLMAKMFGTTLSQSAEAAQKLNEEAEALENVSEAAQKAKGNLAGFDEINKLGSADTSDSDTTYNFDDFYSDDYKEKLDDLLGVVLAVGAGLLAWKISDAFGASLRRVAGIALIVGGAIEYAYSWADAFSNGIDWGNLSGILAGMVAVVGVLALEFGSTGAAIGVLITGAGLVVLALHEFITTGELTTQALIALEVGILAIGVAISLLTGSWIPVLVAAIVGIVIAVATKGDEIKGYLQKLDDWLQNVFATDWTELFGPILGGALNMLCDAAKNVWTSVKRTLDGLIDFIGGVFTGDWKKAWDGVKSIFSAAINALPQSFKLCINGVIKLFNMFIAWLNERMNFSWDDQYILGQKIVSAGSIQLFTIPDIPYLAQGAVIPPNAPFMAVLGDQKNGTNIEAPADLIRKIVREEMANGSSNEEIAALLRELINVVLGIQVGDEVIGRAAARYNRKASRAGGY